MAQHSRPPTPIRACTKPLGTSNITPKRINNTARLPIPLPMPSYVQLCWALCGMAMLKAKYDGLGIEEKLVSFSLDLVRLVISIVVAIALLSWKGMYAKGSVMLIIFLNVFCLEIISVRG